MKRFVFLIGLVAMVAVSPFLGLRRPRAQAGPAGANAISAGLNRTCALKDGGVWCWGSGGGGGPKEPVQVSSLVPVPGLESGVSAISVGGLHTCAMKDGGAWCWGSNGFGELGNSSTYDRFAPRESAVPVPVLGLQGGVSAISAGSGHTCALKDGGVWCWGQNQYGQLGNNSTTDSRDNLQPFRAGIGLLASELRLPVVPIWLDGLHDVLPKGASRPKSGPVTVRIGSPIRVPATNDYATITALLEQTLANLREGARQAVRETA